jgi:hypothetical protein
MRTLIAGLGVVGMLVMGTTSARAHDAYDDSESHPLRLVAYAVHPVGFALEWLVTRPLHFVVSNKGFERMFGHVPHESAYGSYAPYAPGEDGAYER